MKFKRSLTVLGLVALGAAACGNLTPLRSADPSRQHLKVNGAECLAGTECRSGFCLEALGASTCFEEWGYQCVQLGAETSLPISGDLDVSCGTEKPRMKVCGYEVTHYWSQCDQVVPTGNPPTGGFKFYCCPN